MLPIETSRCSLSAASLTLKLDVAVCLLLRCRVIGR